MTAFDAWAVMVGTMGIAGGLFVLWVAPRIEARERKKAGRPHPAE